MSQNLLLPFEHVLCMNAPELKKYATSVGITGAHKMRKIYLVTKLAVNVYGFTTAEDVQPYVDKAHSIVCSER